MMGIAEIEAGFRSGFRDQERNNNDLITAALLVIRKHMDLL